MKRRHVIAASACLILAGQVVVPPSDVAAGNPPKCFGEEATIVRGDGDNTIMGTRGRDVIVSRGGADDVFGLRGVDRICTGPGPDSADGGPGDDKINGGAGPDTETGLEGGNGADRILGGSGADWLFAQHDPLQKDNADQDGNVLIGGKDGDKMYSEEGDDTAKGGGGGDVLEAGSGIDGLYGNFGDDSIDAYDKTGNDIVHGGPDVKGDACATDLNDDRIDCEINLKN